MLATLSTCPPDPEVEVILAPGLDGSDFNLDAFHVTPDRDFLPSEPIEIAFVSRKRVNLIAQQKSVFHAIFDARTRAFRRRFVFCHM